MLKISFFNYKTFQPAKKSGFEPRVSVISTNVPILYRSDIVSILKRFSFKTLSYISKTQVQFLKIMLIYLLSSAIFSLLLLHKNQSHLILYCDCQQMPLQLDDVRLQQYGSDFLRIRHSNFIQFTVGIAYQTIESTELIQLVF